MSTLADLHRRSQDLRVYLDELINGERPVPKYDPALSEYGGIRAVSALELDLLVTHVEVNDLHGTGILVKRMFPDSRQFLHAWTCQAYKVNDFGVIQLFVSGWQTTRYNMYRKALAALKPYKLRRIMCVPFGESDLHLALAMKDARELPLMIYVMDDQNLTSQRIPDSLLREAFAKADVVFAISPEMRDAYEAKFGIKCHVLPPLVRAGDLCPAPVAETDLKEHDAGILLGNIWNAEWLEEIRHVIRGSGVQIHWFGNAGGHVKFDPDELAKDGLVFKGSLPEAQICAKIREYRFGVLPSSPDDKEDWLAKYSIPTRLVTSVAAGNLPMIVIGSERSASSQFVKRFDVGVVCPYRADAFAKAVAEITASDAQIRLRRNAAESARIFSDEKFAEWLWRTLGRGRPEDDRFEDAFRSQGEGASWQMPALFTELAGRPPAWVLEAGSLRGAFWDGAPQVFPEARYVYAGPMAEGLGKRCSWFFEKHPRCEWRAAVVGGSVSSEEFAAAWQVFDKQEDAVEPASMPPTRTLDALATDLKLEGRGMVVLEHSDDFESMLDGGAETLGSANAVLVKFFSTDGAPEALALCRAATALAARGFRGVGEAREPNGTRLVLFLPEDNR